MFVLLVVLAVLLAVSVLIVLVADRLLRALRRGPGRASASGGSATPPRRPSAPVERPQSETRPARRRSDRPGPERSPQPGTPPVAARPPADPPAPSRPETPARPAEPVPPPAETRSRRISAGADREDPRRGRGRKAGVPERLHLARIEPSTRQRYAQTFQRTSARFAEEPATALSDADKLVTLLMDERGLSVPAPGGDAGAEAAQSTLMGDYLAAHAIAEASRSKEVSREELEAGMARYQRLVLALLDDGEGAGAGAPRG